MVDVKRLKGSLDLAQMNHTSLQNADSLAALEAAEAVYNAALKAEAQEDAALADFADAHSDEEIEEAQRKLDKLKATKGMVPKASVTRTDGAGSGHRKTSDAEDVGKVEVKPNHQAAVINLDPTTTSDAASATVPSEATKVAQTVADEQKKSGVPPSE